MQCGMKRTRSGPQLWGDETMHDCTNFENTVSGAAIFRRYNSLPVESVVTSGTGKFPATKWPITSSEKSSTAPAKPLTVSLEHAIMSVSVLASRNALMCITISSCSSFIRMFRKFLALVIISLAYCSATSPCCYQSGMQLACRTSTTRRTGRSIQWLVHRLRYC